METVSQKAFDAWKLHQTTLINERRLDLSIAENRTFLIEEMHKFFDNKEVAQAEGFVDPNKTLDNVVQSYQPPLSDNK
jgi:Fe-S cluster biosynthesis and repair protein YggX